MFTHRNLLLSAIVLPGIIIFWAICLIIFATTFIPILIFRLLLNILLPAINKQFAKILSAQGSLFHQENLVTVNTFYVDGEHNIDQLRESFMNKVISLKSENQKLKYPEFQQYLQYFSGFLFWKWVKDFKIEDYIFLYDASQHKDHNDLIAHFQSSKEFALKRKSPWNLLLIKNESQNLRFLNGSGSVKENTSTLLFIHSHSMMDGFCIYYILFEVLGGIPFPHFKVPEKSNLLVLLLKILGLMLHRTFLLFIDSKAFFDTNQFHVRNLNPGHKQNSRVHVSNLVDMGLIKKIQQKHQVCRGSVIFACLTGAMRKAMLKKGGIVPENIRIWQPYPRESHPPALTNHFDVSEIYLPVGLDDPLERLNAIRKEIQNQDGTFQLASKIGMKFFGCMPRFIQLIFSRSNYVTVSFSRLALPPNLKFLDRDVIGHNFSVGTANGDTPFHLFCLGYNHQLQYCLHAPNELLSKEEGNQFLSMMNEELMELAELSYPEEMVSAENIY